MTTNEIRVPRQKRSMEKKKRIIKAGYKLFSDKGYFKTNTAEIAEKAGVSTGIVYNYFCDKKDILLEVVKLYIDSLSEGFASILSIGFNSDNLPEIIEQLINASIASHTMGVRAHNEFFALSLLEKDIFNLFNDFENNVLSKIYDLLVKAGFSKTQLKEKLKLSYGIVEHLSHNYIQQNISPEELNTAKALSIQTIVLLLTDTQ